MSKEEKTIAKSLAEALQILPDGKREYLIGFAEGVAARRMKRSEPRKWT